MTFRLKEYLSRNGRTPFRAWLEGIPVESRAKLQARLFRIELGNLGDFKRLGHGLNELRLAFGPGYRIYFGFDESNSIVLIMGRH